MLSSALRKLFPDLEIIHLPIINAIDFSTHHYKPSSISCQVPAGYYPANIKPHVKIYRLENGTIQEICKSQATMTLSLVDVPLSSLNKEYYYAFVISRVLESIKSEPSPSQQIYIRGSNPTEIEELRRAFSCAVPLSALSFRTSTPSFFPSPLATRRDSPSPFLQSLMQEIKKAISAPQSAKTYESLGTFG